MTSSGYSRKHPPYLAESKSSMNLYDFKYEEKYRKNFDNYRSDKLLDEMREIKKLSINNQ